MSESTVGLIVFFVIAAIAALLWQRFAVSYVVAVIGSTVTAVITFQIVAYMHIGYLDPFSLIAVATSSVLAAVIASVIGLPFRAHRKINALDDDAL